MAGMSTTPRICPECGSNLEERPGCGPHHKGLHCPSCRQHRGWLPKPKPPEAPATEKQIALVRRLWAKNPPSKRLASVFIRLLGGEHDCSARQAVFGLGMALRLDRQSWRELFEWLKERQPAGKETA